MVGPGEGRAGQGQDVSAPCRPAPSLPAGRTDGYATSAAGGPSRPHAHPPPARALARPRLLTSGTAGGGLRRARRASKRLRRLLRVRTSGLGDVFKPAASQLRGSRHSARPPAPPTRLVVASRDSLASVWSEARPYNRRRSPSCPGRALGSAGAAGAPGASRQPAGAVGKGRADEVPFSTAPPAEEEELHVALEELGAARGELRVPLVPRVPDAEERDRLAEEGGPSGCGTGCGTGLEAWRN